MPIIQTLEKTAVACGGVVLALRNQHMQVQDKSEQLGAHFSTQADRLSQEVGLKMLMEEMPGEVIIAEESENGEKIAPNCTVFDPLDGTTIYFNHHDDFSVSLCTLRDGRPQYAATYFPTRSLLISAVRNEGCYVGGFQKGTQLQKIYWHGLLDKTLIGTDIGSWAVRHDTYDTVLRPLSESFNIISSISATEGARKVLFGQVGVFYNFGIAKIWDAAAMSLAIQEAGGIACDPKGNPIDWSSVDCDWIVAANQSLADVIIKSSCSWRGRVL